MTTDIDSLNVPSHVAPHLVFDFDIYGDPRIGEDVQGTYSTALANAPEIFWTPRNGGHWISKSFRTINQIVTDHEHFSVREMQIPRVENPPFFIPLSLDPPDNLPYRRAMQPMFGPVAVKALEGRIREWAAKFVDAVVDQGHCDFQADISKAFPVSVFMELMGMDLARLRDFRHLAESFFESSLDPQEMERLSGVIIAEMQAIITQKKDSPDDKLVTHFLNVDIGGRTMTDEEITAMCFILFLGGMDTVTNVTGFTFQQLAQMPDVQARLAEEPSAIPKFVDESIRLFGVVNTPRLVVQQKQIGAAQFQPGDMVLCILCLGSRDPNQINDPDIFNLDRKKITHLTFSSGPHLCIGHALGRTELRIIVEEWVKRIPAFIAIPGERHAFRTGTVMALESLPLQWDLASVRQASN